MLICFFGYPNESYSRNKILIDGLKKNGIKVISCTDKNGFFPIRAWRLFAKFWPLKKEVDLIFVQFPGYLNMPIAWAIGKLFRKPIIFDAFVSIYDTYIYDREIAKPNSPTAWFYWWVDKIACTLADIVTLDTNAHIRYFIKTFHLNKKKFFRIPVGGDETLFHPSKLQRSGVMRRKIVIEFHGMFTKIHGAETFVRVSKQLENHPDLEFWLIGDSHNYRLPIELYHQLKPKNMHYWPRLTETTLAKKISQADISIGHLGSTQKAKMVMTNKMYHALASQVALVAADNAASREFLTDKKNAYFIKHNDEAHLKKAVLSLTKNKKLRQKLATNGYVLHQNQFTNQQISLKLLQVISQHFPHIR